MFDRLMRVSDELIMQYLTALTDIAWTELLDLEERWEQDSVSVKRAPCARDHDYSLRAEEARVAFDEFNRVRRCGERPAS